MKKRRIIILIIVFSGLISFTCSKDEITCKNEGEIIGFDATRCVCCGGWKVKIGDNIYLADSVPSGILDIGSDGNHIVPQRIYLDYDPEPYCQQKRIRILCMRKRN